MPLVLDAIADHVVTLIGVPSDENSSLIPGPASAPAVIRSALYDRGSNMTAEDGCHLAGNASFVDAGDVTIRTDDPAVNFAAIRDGAAAVLARRGRVLALGGDHAVSYPIVQAYADHCPGFSVVQIDAHPDLYADFGGNPYSHASGFARIMEGELVRRLVQVGIRAATPHQREQAVRFGVEIVDLRADAVATGRLPEGPVYLSLDLDGIDPAFAPGVSHPEPGGLSTRDVLRVIDGLPGPLIGADIVELNPRRDIAGATALVAAKCAKEIAARMLRV